MFGADGARLDRKGREEGSRQARTRKRPRGHFRGEPPEGFVELLRERQLLAGAQPAWAGGVAAVATPRTVGEGGIRGETAVPPVKRAKRATRCRRWQLRLTADRAHYTSASVHTAEEPVLRDRVLDGFELPLEHSALALHVSRRRPACPAVASTARDARHPCSEEGGPWGKHGFPREVERSEDDAEGGNRTHTARRPPDFESGASASSATSASNEDSPLRSAGGPRAGRGKRRDPRRRNRNESARFRRVTTHLRWPKRRLILPRLVQ
jgi:hypothetical protein